MSVLGTLCLACGAILVTAVLLALGTMRSKRQ